MSAANSECPPSRSEKDDGGRCENTLISVVSFIGRPLMEGSDLRLAPPCYGSFPQDRGLSALILSRRLPKPHRHPSPGRATAPSRQEEEGKQQSFAGLTPRSIFSLLHAIPALLSRNQLPGEVSESRSAARPVTLSPCVSEGPTANRHAPPDPSHLDTAASQWDVSVLSRQSTMGYPELELLSEPPAWAGISNISFPS